MTILNYYLSLADIFYKTICQLYTTESQTNGDQSQTTTYAGSCSKS